MRTLEENENELVVVEQALKRLYEELTQLHRRHGQLLVERRALKRAQEIPGFGDPDYYARVCHEAQMHDDLDVISKLAALESVSRHLTGG